MKCTMSLLLLVSFMGISLVCGLPVADPPITFSREITKREVPTSTKKPIDPNHVPQSACKDMQPIHGPFQPGNNAEAQFDVLVDTDQVKPGGIVRVTIKGRGNETFKGIYTQGRVNDKPVGEFRKVNDDPLIVISDCPDGEKNAASYISNIYAINKVELDWRAPDLPNSEVIFKATVVKKFSEFWVGLTSRKVKITNAA